MTNDPLENTSHRRRREVLLAAVIAVGYVLGAKAGRRRYEQIASTYRAVTANPATKAVLDKHLPGADTSKDETPAPAGETTPAEQ